MAAGWIATVIVASCIGTAWVGAVKLQASDKPTSKAKLIIVFLNINICHDARDLKFLQ